MGGAQKPSVGCSCLLSAALRSSSCLELELRARGCSSHPAAPRPRPRGRGPAAGREKLGFEWGGLSRTPAGPPTCMFPDAVGRRAQGFVRDPEPSLPGKQGARGTATRRATLPARSRGPCGTWLAGLGREPPAGQRGCRLPQLCTQRRPPRWARLPVGAQGPPGLWAAAISQHGRKCGFQAPSFSLNRRFPSVTET